MNYMASEYQYDAMQYRSKPVKVKVSRSSTNLFEDDESIPNQTLPNPLQRTPQSYDGSGDITVTPDKRGDGYMIGNSGRRTVSFKDGVDVQLMSPRNSFDKTFEQDYVAAMKDRLLKPSTSLQQFDNNRKMPSLSSSKRSLAFVNMDRQTSLESLDSAEMTHSSEESLDTVDIVASDFMQPVTTARTVPDHPLSRPEFSSILKLKQHQKFCQKTNVDVASALKNKLSIAKTRTKVDELAYKHLNREEVQFQRLRGTDVDENRIAETEKVLNNRNHLPVKPKTEVGKRREPDIFEFFKDEFQKESASYSIETQVPSQCVPKPVDLNQAFDVYQHARSWEGL